MRIRRRPCPTPPTSRRHNGSSSFGELTVVLPRTDRHHGAVWRQEVGGPTNRQGRILIESVRYLADLDSLAHPSQSSQGSIKPP